MNERIDRQLLAHIEAAIAHARACGALQPIATEQAVVEEDGMPIQVRWVSSLARKDAVRPPASTRPADFNPFLPPDPDLLVCEAGPQHRVVLNKFPVMERHILAVTRAFEAQTAPLSAADWAVMADLLHAADGLAFYNGGSIAGASQPHKHLQWIAGDSGDPHFLPFAGRLAQARPQLPFLHHHALLQDTSAGALQQTFDAACGALGLRAAEGALPPYNLLLTRHWMLVVPRSREHWQDISVNALGYAGSLFVRRPEQMALIRDHGPLRLLTETGFPG